MEGFENLSADALRDPFVLDAIITEMQSRNKRFPIADQNSGRMENASKFDVYWGK